MLRKIVLSTVLCIVSAAALADTPALDERQANQRQRIADGVQSGELTKPEAHRLRKAERSLHRHEARAEADGVVTRRERAQLQHHANDVSRRIARQKHDRQDRSRAD